MNGIDQGSDPVLVREALGVQELSRGMPKILDETHPAAGRRLVVHFYTRPHHIDFTTAERAE